MRVLVLSSVYPNSKQPTFGVFVRERMKRVARQCELRVVAPVPWFPLNGLIRGPQWNGIPQVESQDEIWVYHPRIFCIPRYFKWLDGLFYACSLVLFMARLRQEFPFDLIDAHFAYPDGLAAVLLGKLFRVPVMITLRGSIVRLSQYPIHRPQLRWTLRHAAGIAAVSQSLRQEAVTLGIRKDRIHVIPNGVDTDRFFPRDRQSARVACGLPSDRMVLLSVGGITEGKGQHLVMDAMSQLVASYPDLLYVMVGAERRGDPFRRCLERRIAAHKLQDHVYLAGQRPHTELPAWYASADLFCLATRSEGWANVLLESLACGIPVVTTNVGGNPEIIRENRDGILVIPGDSRRLATAIETALQRGWDREGMVAYARNHCWERAAEEVLKMFCSLLSQDSSGRRVALATDNLSGRCP